MLKHEKLTLSKKYSLDLLWRVYKFGLEMPFSKRRLHYLCDYWLIFFSIFQHQNELLNSSTGSSNRSASTSDPDDESDSDVDVMTVGDDSALKLPFLAHPMGPKRPKDGPKVLKPQATFSYKQQWGPNTMVPMAPSPQQQPLGLSEYMRLDKQSCQFLPQMAVPLNPQVQIPANRFRSSFSIEELMRK